MNKLYLSKVKAFTAIIVVGFIIINLNINTASALSGSYTYSVKGSNIYLTPAISADTEYYRWIIEGMNGTVTNGATDWIFHNYTFVQQFTLDYAGEYLITLEVRNLAGTIQKYSRFITTARSSLSVQDQRTDQTDTSTDLGRINLVDAFVSFFNTFSSVGKLFFIAICLIVGIFLFDVVFNVSKGRKTTLYKVVYRRK